MNPFYKDYAGYLSEKFPGVKMQKLSVNAGFSCPNRDGTIGRGGCIYCDNTTFTPSYCFGHQTVMAQLEAGKKFFARKYPSMRFLAYFQSYTNTFASGTTSGIDDLEGLYREALGVEGVDGLIIGSRPDCFPEEVVEMLSRLNRECRVFVEIGVESSHDVTLQRINRGHTFAQTADAVERMAKAGIAVGAHLIMGLPGETEEMMLESVDRICELPVESVKFHHLQVIASTELHRQYERGAEDIRPFAMEDYLALCEKIVRKVPRHIAIERFLASSPPDRVVAPKWGIKNYEFVNLLINRLKNKEK